MYRVPWAVTVFWCGLAAAGVLCYVMLCCSPDYSAICTAVCGHTWSWTWHIDSCTARWPVRARRTRVRFTRPDPALLLRRLDDSFTVAQSSSTRTHTHEQVSCSCSPHQRESQYRCASTPALGQRDRLPWQPHGVDAPARSSCSGKGLAMLRLARHHYKSP